MVLSIATGFLAVLVLTSCVSEGFVYNIDVVTSTIDYAGTNSAIYIRLLGKKRSTKDHNLDSAGNDFERGETNNFVINDKNVGYLECIELRIDGSDGWRAETITVAFGTEGAKYRVNNINTWLDDDETIELCNLEEVIEYNVALETHAKKFAGTDSDIFITLRGYNGTTEEHLLDNEGENDFESGDTNNFVFYDREVGPLECIVLRIDGGDRYRAKSVTVLNVDSGTKYSSEITEWLDDDDIESLSLCDITEDYTAK